MNNPKLNCPVPVGTINVSFSRKFPFVSIRKVDKLCMCSLLDFADKKARQELDDIDLTPIIRPEGCKCRPGEWLDSCCIPPVCDKFKPDRTHPEYCDECVHPKECHHGESKSTT